MWLPTSKRPSCPTSSKSQKSATISYSTTEKAPKSASCSLNSTGSRNSTAIYCANWLSVLTTCASIWSRIRSCFLGLGGREGGGEIGIRKRQADTSWGTRSFRKGGIFMGLVPTQKRISWPFTVISDIALSFIAQSMQPKSVVHRIGNYVF